MKKIFSFLLFLILSLSFVFSVPTINAYAEINGVNFVTDALTDLSKDENFDKDSFPVKENDYSLELITISETTDKNLNIYIYQPSGNTDVIAKKVRIAFGNKSTTFSDYDLILLNQTGVFQKYQLKDYTVSDDTVRYYSIVSFLRNPIGDEVNGANGNTVSLVPFSVGKYFTIKTDGSSLSVSVEDLEIIEIDQDSKYVGFMRYPAGGLSLIDYSADVHFVAFSTNKEIEYLKEVEISYKQQYREWGSSTTSYESFGSVEERNSIISIDNNFSWTGKGWFANDYSWNTIEKSSDFISNEETPKIYSKGIVDSVVESEIDELAKDTISKTQWVVRFALTEYSYKVTHTANFMHHDYTATIVSDVTILRLAFTTNGIDYNLGVVDGYQTGDLTPDNTVKTKLVFDQGFLILLFLILLIILYMFFGPVFNILFSVLWSVIKFIFKILFIIISLPFKVLRSLFRSKKT